MQSSSGSGYSAEFNYSLTVDFQKKFINASTWNAEKLKFPLNLNDCHRAAQNTPDDKFGKVFH